MRLTLIALAALTLAGPAVAVTPEAGPLIAKPKWVRTPTGDEISRLYPKAASDKGVGGTVVVGCIVKADGALTDCEVLQDPDPTLGFGPAAVKAALLFRMAPTTVDGAPVAGGRVRFPLVFQPGPVAEPSKFPGQIRDRQDRQIGTFKWKAKPSGANVNTYFPELAMRKGVGGKTTLDCEITAEGIMRRCWVISESPLGYGFGEAGVSLSQFFRLKVESKTVESVDGGVVRIPLTFSAVN
ncbi:MAG: TonB family protein [Caulobacteraceae bacterium]|nr:MAG: TonB family protein [Caulobacteraceae bacterium]